MIKYFFLIFFICISITGNSQKKFSSQNDLAIKKDLSDSALLDLVQKQTIKYFWDFAHPVSGMARERSNAAYNYGDEVVTTGGTGFGIMAVIVGAERKWMTRDSVAQAFIEDGKFFK